MPDFALSFSSGGNEYTFLQPEEFDPRFSRMQSMIVPLPGQHGGFDQNHAEEDRSAVGTLSIRCTLVASTISDMQTLIDEVSSLPYLGRQKLYYQPQGAFEQRWCLARVSSVDLGMRAVDGLLIQRVRVQFAVSDPFWSHDEENVAQACSGVSTDITATNDGNAVSLVRAVVACGGAQTCENVTIERSVDGTVMDSVLYTGVVGNSETLTIDAVAKSIDLDGTGKYTDLTFTHPDWLRLLPGSNTFTVKFENVGDAATVTLNFSDSFRS